MASETEEREVERIRETVRDGGRERYADGRDRRTENEREADEWNNRGTARKDREGGRDGGRERKGEREGAIDIEKKEEGERD